MQLGQLQQIESALLDLGFQVIAISPDRPANLEASVEKHSLTYTLLSDSDMEASRAFGLAYEVDPSTLETLRNYGTDLEAASGEKHHQLPVPAVFLLRTDGLITFMYANPNYKVRLDPRILLAAARAEEEKNEK